MLYANRSQPFMTSTSPARLEFVLAELEQKNGDGEGHRTGQDRTGQDRTGQDSSRPNRTLKRPEAKLEATRNEPSRTLKRTEPTDIDITITILIYIIIII